MYKYSVILGNLGNTCDRFCKGYKDNPSTEEMLAEAVKIPYVEGIELVGTWDIRPDNVKDMKQRMQDYGKTCVSIIPDVFTDKIYSKGTITNNDPAIRRKALDYLCKIGEIALEMDCKLVNMWMAQDGYDYLLSTDYDQKRDWLCEGTAALAKEFPTLKFALEYKPKEPRNFSFHARMADTLLAAQETGCDNKLFHMHFNDNHGSWDDDMIVASVHSTIYIDLLFHLKKTGYQGWLSMDQYPYREHATDAIAESVLWVRRFEEIVESNFTEIENLIRKDDAVETSRFMRKALFGK